jgi:putative addiction module CopG family antidote
LPIALFWNGIQGKRYAPQRQPDPAIGGIGSQHGVLRTIQFASEVVREALRIMEAHDELQSLKLEQLRRDIRDGLNSGPARPWGVAGMKREGRKHLGARRPGAKIRP